MWGCVNGCLLLSWPTLNWRVAYFGRYSIFYIRNLGCLPPVTKNRQLNRSSRKGSSEVKTKLTTIFVGVFIAVVAWMPLWIVEARDPYAMPVGLGLLTFAASVVGVVIALVGLIKLVIHAARNPKTPS